MTVGELIAELRGYPQNSEMFIMLSEDGDEFCPAGLLDKDGCAVWLTGEGHSNPLTYDEVAATIPS